MTNPSTNLRNFALTLLATASAAAVVEAQAPTAQDRAGLNTDTQYSSTSRLIGAPVYLEATMKAKEEAAEEGEKADRPTAEVTEWLIDSHDGSLDYAVISVGGVLGIGDKIVMVPAKNLAWNNAMERFELGWTLEQLKSQPAFNIDKAVEEGLDKHCNIDDDKRATGKVAAEASTEKRGNAAEASSEYKARPQEAIAGTTFKRCGSRMVRGSELMELPVYAGKESFGTTSDLIVDRKANRVVLAVVNHGSTVGLGGTNYLLPFERFTVCVDEDDDALLCTPTGTVAELKQSVEFEEPENGAVDPAAAKKALENAKSKKN